MSANTSNLGPQESHARSWWRCILLLVAAVAITIFLFIPAKQPATVTLDDSNYTSYAFFTAHGFQYGPQVVPPVGPLGFVLYGFVYAGDLFWGRLVLDLALKFGFAVVLLAFFRRSRLPVARWIWLGALLLLTPLIGDAPFDFAILLTGILLLTGVRGNLPSWSVAASAGYLALLSLLKGTECVLAGATMGLLIATALLAGRRRYLTIALAAFLGTGAVGWLGTGQNPAHLPEYLRGIFELSAGYNDAMSLQESPAVFRTGLGVLCLLFISIGVALVRQRRDWTRLAALVLVAGFTFIIWKHGFVRADGHVLIFFWYAVVIAATVVLLGADRTAEDVGHGRSDSVLAWSLRVTALLAACGGIYASGPESLAGMRWQIKQLPGRFVENTRYLLSPARRKANLERELEAQRARYALGQTTATVGNASIDFFGLEHGLLPLNRLNYQPRPMGGGSFSVYTPYLERRNERHLLDPRTRPAYVLTRLQTIDNRLFAQDDARTLLALVRSYTPVDTEQGMLLLRALPSSTVPAERLLAERTFSLGESVEVPAAPEGELVLASFEIPQSLRGRVRSFLYKSPMLQIDVEGDDFPAIQQRRLVAGMVRLPILFSPVVESTADVLSLYGGSSSKQARRFRITSATPELFTPKLTVRFHAMPRPAPLASTAVAALQARLRFPAADVAPLQMKPADAPLRDFDGYIAQMLQSPGEITFPLQGDERSVTFDYGIDPEAYERGDTNGVEFLVEVWQAGVIRQPLFTRLLVPKTQPADRGRQSARVVLPPLNPGSTLRLRTEPGPQGNTAWDWAYFSKIRHHRGPYQLEQFPGFQNAPVLVQNPSPGILDTPEGPVFMLNAPSRLEFELSGKETSVQLEGGILPGAYSDGGRSDGITLLVELKTPRGEIVPVFQRRLNPRDLEADRGTQRIQVSLPNHTAGTRLVVRADAGPTGDTSWDWTYLRALDIN